MALSVSVEHGAWRIQRGNVVLPSEPVFKGVAR